MEPSKSTHNDQASICPTRGWLVNLFPCIRVPSAVYAAVSDSSQSSAFTLQLGIGRVGVTSVVSFMARGVWYFHCGTSGRINKRRSSHSVCPQPRCSFITVSRHWITQRQKTKHEKQLASRAPPSSNLGCGRRIQLEMQLVLLSGRRVSSWQDEIWFIRRCRRRYHGAPVGEREHPWSSRHVLFLSGRIYRSAM